MGSLMESIKHRTVAVNGISMHIAEAGPADAPTILFLHGFPELWYAWRHQILSLAGHGYRCVAPDLRGYGDSDAPPDHTAYTVFHVVGDLVALLDVLGQRQVRSAIFTNNMHIPVFHISSPKIEAFIPGPITSEIAKTV